MNVTCKDCTYYHANTGTCRRNPPMATRSKLLSIETDGRENRTRKGDVDWIGGWHDVRLNDGCGEWLPNDFDLRKERTDAVRIGLAKQAVELETLRLHAATRELERKP